MNRARSGAAQASIVVLVFASVACTNSNGGPPDAGGWIVPDAGPNDAGVAPSDGGSGNSGSDGGNVQPSDGGRSLNDGGGGIPDGGELPTITSITPPFGPVTGQTNIIIFGSGFANGFAPNGGLQADSNTTVWIHCPTCGSTTGEVTGTTINIIDDTIMELATPSGIQGPADVILSNPNTTAYAPGGKVTCSSCFTYVANISVTSISPTSGPTYGGTALTINGSGFAPGQLVLVGNSEATNISVNADAGTITCTTPPGTAGSADIGIVGPDAEGWLRRSFVYWQPMTITNVSPPVSPLAGGGTVTITGTGFTQDAVLVLGSGAPITPTGTVTATQLTATIPAATTAGAVNVEVQNEYTSATLADGFAYYDDSASVQIYAVVPQQGPVAGNIPVTLLGTGLVAADGLQVAFGNNLVTSGFSGNANALIVTVPAATAPGTVDVQARTSAGGFDLPQSFAYITPLTVTAISPTSGPEAGGTSVTVTGTGFSSGCQLFVGAGLATGASIAANGNSITGTTAPGAAGASDVRVVCGTPGTPGYQQATLAQSFTYTAAMSLLSLDPGTGATAGGTAVALYGDGFVDKMQVLFGGAPATNIQVLSANQATVLSPPGAVGYVGVTIAVPGLTVPSTGCPSGSTNCATLPQSFGYYDPTNTNGGGSNGPMLGILNVTVLNSFDGLNAPVQGATVSVNQDQLTGLTDARGQITFSSPELLKPVTITASLSGYAAASIALINARDVTLFISGAPAQMGMSPPSCSVDNGGCSVNATCSQTVASDGGNSISCTCNAPYVGDGYVCNPPPATFEGKVCGFKLATGMQLSSNQTEVAQVYETFPYVYAAPPFGTMPTPVVVTSDCGTFSFQTSEFGPIALYAVFGIQDNSTVPPTFTPLIMGIERGLQANPGGMTTGIDLILSMALDQTIPVTIDESALGLGGTQSIINQVYSYLDLGGEGVVPLASTTSTATTFPFNNQPEIEGQSMIFLNFAAVFDATTQAAEPPYSLCFQTQDGNLEAGITIGPMMAFTTWDSPMSTDTFSGTMTWSFTAGNPANLQQLSLDISGGFSSAPIWSAVLPGTDDSVTIPPSAVATFPSGTMVEWTLITAVSPRLEYNSFGFEQLGINDFTSFTENFGQFNTASAP